MNIEPLGGGFLAVADFIADSRIENLRAAASDGAKPSRAQSFQRITDGHPENPLRQMAGLDRREGLDVKVRIESAQSLQKLQIPLFFERRVQSTHHVHLRNSEVKSISHCRDNFVNRIFKGVCIAFFGSKSTELTR
jgi:hypothetical protein